MTDNTKSNTTKCNCK